MTYESARSAETRRIHRLQIDRHLRRYNPELRTVVLLPGGMGSQLDLSRQTFKDGTRLPFDRYDPLWIHWGIIFAGHAHRLAIDDQRRDYKKRIVVASGPLDFFVTPYDGTREYFDDEDHPYNYLVFGYDWRRPLHESARLLRFFLNHFKKRVMDLGYGDPLPKTSLFCHSMGGLVAKTYLHLVLGQDNVNKDVPIDKVITVATPFYGASTHMHRYYVGKDPFNLFYEPDGKTKIAQIIGTLPGPYTLMFLDQQTFEAHQEGFEEHGELTEYPVCDADQPQQAADPYAQSSKDRFPPWVQWAHAAKARKARELVAADLPSNVAERMFHIRSGNNTKTLSKLYWSNVDGAHFDPETDDCPIHGEEGCGDDTVPVWSARLVQTPDERVYSLPSASEHGELAEHTETLDAVRTIIEESHVPGQISAPDRKLGVAKAPKSQVNELLTKFAEHKAGLADTHDKRLWRCLIEELSMC